MVTLHVSVWVEIFQTSVRTRSAMVTLHVSVWVEMKFSFISVPQKMSRSTWACELKLSNDMLKTRTINVTLHVSVWVEIYPWKWPENGSLSRSTWACELKWRLWGYIKYSKGSRSTWACELKFDDLIKTFCYLGVTLHVSVWVEISFFNIILYNKTWHIQNNQSIIKTKECVINGNRKTIWWRV